MYISVYIYIYIYIYTYIHTYTYISTQGGGASHDGLGVLVSTASLFFPNHTFAHDLPHPSWAEIKVHLKST